MDETCGRTSEEGSRQLIWAAIGAAGQEDSLRGQYIHNRKPMEVSDVILDEAGIKAQSALWVR